MEIEVGNLRGDPGEPPDRLRQMAKKLYQGVLKALGVFKRLGSGVNKILNLSELAQFIWAIVRYIATRLKSVLYSTFYLIRSTFKFFGRLKYEITRKLIWGRGRLGRPASHLSVLALSSTVFVFGGLLPGSKIVQSKSYDTHEFLPVGGDVLAATTVSITELTGRPSTDPIGYVVEEGDTLSSIGQKYNITVDAIRYANNLTDLNYLRIGQELTIPPIEGVVYEVGESDTLEGIADKFSVASQAIVDFNYLDEPFELSVGQKLIIPDAEIPQPRPKALVQRPAVPSYPSYDVDAYSSIPYSDSGMIGTGQFIWPTDARFISQYFSWYHPAVDITKGGAIYAADAGTVIRAGWWPNGYGYAVQLDHGNGYTSTYAHLSRIDISVGSSVGQGQVLGMMGSTGRSTGTHLHFVVQYYGQYINPLNFF